MKNKSFPDNVAKLMIMAGKGGIVPAHKVLKKITHENEKKKKQTKKLEVF